MDRVNLVVTNDLALNEGLRSYALRQAALRDELAKHFAHIWHDTGRYRELARSDRDTDSEIVVRNTSSLDFSGM